MANEKRKITTIRKPYYQCQDGLWALSDAVRETEDVELIAMLDLIREAMFTFETKMSAKMEWD